MSKNKKLLLKVLLCGIFVVLMSYVFINVRYLFYLNSTEGYNQTRLFKRLIPLFCTVIVFIIGKNNINKKDLTMLKISYLMICGAEVAFIFNQFIMGVVFFGSCQILLSIRHFAAVLPALKYHKKKMYILGTIIVAVLIVLSTFVFYPILQGGTIFYTIIIYALFLGISLWIGFAPYFSDVFPKKNGILIMIGMVLFFVSDIIVGLEVISDDVYINNIFNLILWTLYAPAITLIALSGFKYKDHRTV
ncbi:UNVERIFIED_CONTAM: hypothetical protein Cloal_0751 [Acetivibrio alkalicellulosi]